MGRKPAHARMMAIIGSGFGLYGYMPALLACGVTPVLPDRYRAVVERRNELRAYLDRIVWAADTEATLARAHGAVIAIRPVDQAAMAARCLAYPQLRHIVLEKPLAPEPGAASRLLAAMLPAGRRFRIGYLFPLTSWFGDLREAVRRGETIAIDWTFMAHHFAHGLDNWKRRSADGGGAVGFYGIHLLACLAACGYSCVESSTIHGEGRAEISRWQARLTGAGLPPCSLNVDSRSEHQRFTVLAESATRRRSVVNATDPFEMPPQARPALVLQDRRVGLLIRLLESLSDDDAPFYDLYQRTNELWREAAACAVFVGAAPRYALQLSNAERWGLRAEEYRALADATLDPGASAAVERLAMHYDKLAEQQKSRIRPLSPDACRARAEECRRFARTMRTPANRSLILGLADQWQRLAESGDRSGSAR